MTNSKILQAGSALLAISLWALPANADTTMKHTQGMTHSSHTQGAQKPAAKMPTTGVQPTEPGQGAFATIGEIVVLLEKDPNTDWSKVNIGALREHLVDMNEVTTRASAKTEVFKDRIVFHVTGSGRTLQAIQAMVMPHSMVLSGSSSWKVTSEKTATGAIMTVWSDNPHELMKVKALGFFGVMATGAHHQAHHYLMAKGATDVHQH